MVVMPNKPRRHEEGRLTKIRTMRRSWDVIIAAYYHHGDYGDKMGYETVARLFEIPSGTVRGAIRRIPKSDPDVRRAAGRFGLLKVNVNVPSRDEGALLPGFGGLFIEGESRLIEGD